MRIVIVLLLTAGSAHAAPGREAPLPGKLGARITAALADGRTTKVFEGRPRTINGSKTNTLALHVVVPGRAARFFGGRPRLETYELLTFRSRGEGTNALNLLEGALGIPAYEQRPFTYQEWRRTRTQPIVNSVDAAMLKRALRGQVAPGTK